MTRAEESAIKAYPVVIEEHTERDVNKPRRLSYIKGYEKAEKDYIELVQLWVDSGDVNIMSFKHFLKRYEIQSNQ
jgi:hypothetical protein